MRVFLLSLLLASATSAQTALDRARAALAEGDSARAHRIVRDDARRGTDDAEVWRLRLRLELAGFGLAGVPRSFWMQQITDDAQALLRRAPADTLALRILTRDAVWTALLFDDRVSSPALAMSGLRAPAPSGARDATGTPVTGVTAETADRASTRSQFDIERRERFAPSTPLTARAESATADALGYLETWLQAAPDARPAYAAALTLAVLAERWEGALLLARAFQANSLDPHADLYAGLAHYRLGDAETAARVFERALSQLAPPDRARFESIGVLLRTEDQAAYAADPVGVTELFWAQTDPRLLTTTQERRTEHRARVVEADLLFGTNATNVFETDPPRGAETQQGEVWIRYGRPQRTITYGAGDRGGPTTVWEYPAFRYVFDDRWRTGIYQLYAPSASAFASRDASGDDYVMQDRLLRRDDPQRTQDGAEQMVEVPALFSRFRAPDGGTEVVAGFGIPTALGAPVTTGVFSVGLEGVRQRVVETRAALTPGRVVGPVWTDAATVSLPASGRVQVEVEARGGAVRGRATAEIAPLAGGFGVSDLLLATSIDDDGRGLVVRDGIGLVPAARAVFPTSALVYVYLEAYGLGLAGGRTDYTVEATLTPQARRGGLAGRIFGRGQGPGVAVRTEAQGDRRDDAVTFFVDVGDQEPGDYTLRVEIQDQVSGRTASAERPITLE